MYTCPMHPQIKQSTPGKCPICGMKLIKESPAHNATTENNSLWPLTWKNYLPLIVIFSLILLVTVILAYRDYQVGTFTFSKAIINFMAGFFTVFAGFKLMDLKGFAEGYSTYNLLAENWFGYGYIYPFIELAFGLVMIFGYHGTALLWIELIVMVFSGLGVSIK